MSALREEYAAFLAAKTIRAQDRGLTVTPTLAPHLFPFQARVTESMLRFGSGGLFLDTGLGKTAVQLEWCRHAAEASNGRAFGGAPLRWALLRRDHHESKGFATDRREKKEPVMTEKQMTKKQIKPFYRQGDVGIERVENLPKGAKKKTRDEQGRIVLAYGEVTGHAHAITCATAIEYELDGQVFVKADGEIELRHEEHGTITLAPGIYKVHRQREYTPEAIRNVAD